MRMLIRLFVMVPIALALIILAVSNRHMVQLVLDPFAPENPAFALNFPLYAYLFGAMFLGIIFGGISTWVSQGRWRRTARRRTVDARKWQKEADRLKRQLAATQEVSSTPTLPAKTAASNTQIAAE